MFNRKFRLELSGTDAPIKSIEELRMDFQYKQHLYMDDKSNMADTFVLEVYNLSVESFKAMTTNKQLDIRFYAGYEDGDKLDLVFEGVVTNVTGMRRIPEHITTLWCIPKGLSKAIKTVSVTTGRGDTVKTMLEKIATSLSLKPTFIGLKDRVDIPYRGITVEGSGIKRIVDIGKQFYFMPRCEGDELRLITLPEEGSIDEITKERKPIVLKADRMRGTPTVSVSKINIPYAFNTDIHTGDIIDTSKLEGSKNNTITGGIGNPNGLVNLTGVGIGSLHYSDTLYKWAIETKYIIMGATHIGSNYTDKYVSNYECAVYTFNSKG